MQRAQEPPWRLPVRSIWRATFSRRYRDILQALSVNSRILWKVLAMLVLLAVPRAAAAQDFQASCKGWERLAIQTEQVGPGHWRLRDNVEITCDTFKFFADEVELFDDEDRLVA